MGDRKQIAFNLLSQIERGSMHSEFCYDWKIFSTTKTFISDIVAIRSYRKETNRELKASPV